MVLNNKKHEPAGIGHPPGSLVTTNPPQDWLMPGFKEDRFGDEYHQYSDRSKPNAVLGPLDFTDLIEQVRLRPGQGSAGRTGRSHAERGHRPKGIAAPVGPNLRAEISVGVKWSLVSGSSNTPFAVEWPYTNQVQRSKPHPIQNYLRSFQMRHWM